jgi:hypothetical protein
MKKNRIKYNNGSLVQRTFETNVGKLSANHSPKNYSVDLTTPRGRLGVQGTTGQTPRSVHASTKVRGANVSGSYNLQNKQSTVNITKPLSRSSSISTSYSNTDGIGVMYRKSISFGK